jgi:hypothetical protein
LNIYVFTSNNLTNIWAGIGARRWAVSDVVATRPGKVGQANNLLIGSLGVLYCSETHELTTPFVVTSRPQPGVIVTNIWPEPWHLPFQITPLGSPTRTLTNNQLAQQLPSVAANQQQWHNILFVRSDFAFQASTITDADWEYLYSNLQHP